MSTNTTFTEEYGDGITVTAIADLAVAASEPYVVEPDTGGKPHAFVIPDGHTLHVEDFGKYGARPARSVSHVTVRDEGSLIALCRDLGTRPRVYADPVNQAIVAILNDDEDPGTAGWRDNRVTIQLVQTEEWKAWIAKNGELMPQREFAEFIEDHFRAIVNPDAATMLEIAQSLEATSHLRVKSSQRLRDGQRKLVYEEDTQARAGAEGDLEVPETLEIALVPWRGRGDTRIPMTARLRFRTTGGNVTMGYKLVDLEGIVEEAFREITDAITAAGIEVITGKP